VLNKKTLDHSQHFIQHTANKHDSLNK
jgi:hypothetical protein